MAIFGRSFPMKSHPFGAIAVQGFLGVIETIDVVGVASQTMSTAEAQPVNQSGTSTTALAAEATKETESNSATATTRLGLDATADTESNSATDSQTLSDIASTESPQNSGSSTQALTAEATKETVSNSAASTQTLVEKTAETITNFEARTNFLLNGGFETNILNTSPFGTNSRDTTEHKFGTASLKSVWLGPPSYQWGVSTTGVGPGVGGAGEFPAGITLTGSAYVKATGTAIGKNFDMQLRDGIGNHSPDNNLILTGEWQRWSATWTIPIQSIISVWAFGSDGVTTAGDTVWIDGMQLELGLNPTDYIETDGAPVTSGGRPWSTQTIVESTSDTLQTHGGAGADTHSGAVLASSPYAYWKVDDASGNLADSSGNARTLTVFGSAYNYQQSPGINERYSISNSSTARAGTTGESTPLNASPDVFTYSAWIKTTEATNRIGIFSAGAYQSEVAVNGPDGKIYLIKSHLGGGDILASNKTVNDGNWHHIAVTSNGQATAKIYIDGEQRSGAVSNPLSFESNSQLYGIGATWNITPASPDANSYFNGSLDELAIFGTCLTADQILTLYNSGHGPNQRITTSEAEITGNSGSGSSSSGEKIAETVANSATATIAIDESISVPSVTDTLSNQGTATIRLGVDATAESDSGSGTGSSTLLDATAEAVTNVGGPAAYGTGSYGGDEYGYPAQTLVEKIAETVSNSATATIAIDESIITPSVTDSLTNQGTATLRVNEAEAQAAGQSGTGSPSLAEATSESVSNQGTGTIRLGVDATADTESNQGTATTRVTDNTADIEANQGTGSQNLTEKTAETISNQGTATLRITDVLPEPPGTSTGTGSQTISEATAETVSNSATATLRITDSQSEAEANQGTGTQTIAEATSEAVANQGTATLRISDVLPEPPGTSTGTGSQTLAEATAETVSNSATSTQTLTATEVASEVNTGTGTQTFAEATAESVTNSASSTQTIGENVVLAGETADNIGTATLRINEAEAGSQTGTGTGSPSLAEATAEAVANSETSTQTFLEATAEGVNNTGTGTQSESEQIPEINLTSTALSSQTLVEKIAETLSNSATSSQTIADAQADTVNNSATNTPNLAELELDSPTNTGTGTHTSAEAVAEYDTVAMLAILTMDEQRDVTVVPFSDISTGTWTVAPLYEKVDELVVMSGYPTETIRSANNPSNDKAILGLAPVSDPGVDDNHFINVEFYKDGSETLDFIINLKEGGTLIATRTFTDVTATAGSPRRERIALTNPEASAIVDYSNLNIELIANQTS